MAVRRTDGKTDRHTHTQMVAWIYSYILTVLTVLDMINSEMRDMFLRVHPAAYSAHRIWLK